MKPFRWLFGPRRGATWHIGPVRHERSGGLERVSADVAGRTVWFTSSSAAFCPAGEALAGAFLIPALHFGATLQVADCLDSEWVANVTRLLAIFQRWWGYPARLPFREVRAPACGSARRETVIGQFFTAGADSFYALLAGGAARRPDGLIYVHGYDVELSDQARMAALNASFAEITAETGIPVHIVQTNLKSHPYFRAVEWPRTHGAALAAVGHLVARHCGTVVIPSSYWHGHDIAWGSHWDTDPLWSSSRVQFMHSEATLCRHERLLRLASQPLVRRHLRVCWENRSPTGNCSRCEKCLRTMVSLAAAGVLSRCTAFDGSIPLARLLDDLPRVRPASLCFWDALQELDLPAREKAAVSRLMQRSQAA